ncbi:MAG: hypothetical protein M3P08_05420 [Thermoproteota archaeon]|nr:hypothetical protein [Thermoproteota archaeon]
MKAERQNKGIVDPSRKPYSNSNKLQDKKEHEGIPPCRVEPTSIIFGILGTTTPISIHIDVYRLMLM